MEREVARRAAPSGQGRSTVRARGGPVWRDAEPGQSAQPGRQRNHGGKGSAQHKPVTPEGPKEGWCGEDMTLKS